MDLRYKGESKATSFEHSSLLKGTGLMLVENSELNLFGFIAIL